MNNNQIYGISNGMKFMAFTTRVYIVLFCPIMNSSGTKGKTFHRKRLL